MQRIYFFKIGGFSRVNEFLPQELATRFPEHELRVVDVEQEIVGRFGHLHLRASAEACMRYGARILKGKLPPRVFFPRLPCVLRAIREWSARNVHPARTAFTLQTQSLFDARRDGTPHFLYTDHTYLAHRRYEQSNPPLRVAVEWRRMEEELYRKATINFTWSQFAARSIVEDYGIPPAQVQCVHSGINTRFPLTVETSRRSGRRILFVAVEWERKGGPDLLKAFSMVRKDIPNAELLVVGCDPGISHPGLSVPGRTTLEGVKLHYEAADIFCLPSRMDPSASVLLEAAGYALPVVATTVGGNAERVVEGETGFLVRPGDVDSLADRLRLLLQDEVLRLKMGARGRERVATLFRWPQVIDRMTGAIRERI